MRERVGDWIGSAVSFVMIFSFFGAMALKTRGWVAAALATHWALALAIGSLLLLMVLMYCVAAWRAMGPDSPDWMRKWVLVQKNTAEDAGLLERYASSTQAALVAAFILLANVGAAGVSTALEARGVFEYDGSSESASPLSELITEFYYWHTIDLLPVVEVWAAYGREAPLQPIGFWAPAFLVVFRTVVVGFPIWIVVQYLRFNRKGPEADAQPSESS